MASKKINVYSIPIWECCLSASILKGCHERLFPILRNIDENNRLYEYGIFLVEGELSEEKRKLLELKLKNITQKSWMIAYGSDVLKKDHVMGKSLLEQISPIDFYIPNSLNDVDQFRNSLLSICKEIEERMNG
jgi:hypothetical protein